MKNILFTLLLLVSFASFGQYFEGFNLATINSFSTLSNEKQMFEPFKISNGKIEHPRLTLLKISQNGKIALAISSSRGGFNRNNSDNIARLIDLTDGAIIFEFPYVSLSNYFFNSDDSKLFYYDNKTIKQIDLKSFDYEITNVFVVESEAHNFQYMFLEKNILYLSQDQNTEDTRKFLLYTYDLTTAKKDLEIFYQFDSYDSNIQVDFSAFSGSTEEKLLKLKLIYGDDIKIKPLTKNSTNEYLILKFPKLFVIKNGEFISDYRIDIKETNRVTNEVRNKSVAQYHVEFQLTDNNRIVLTDRKSLFILQLGSENGFFPNNEIAVTQVDPFEINISSNDDFTFVHLDEKTNRLYYQIDIKYGCDYDSDNEIYVYNYSNKFSPPEKGIQAIIKNKLDEIDKSLSSFYNAHINTEVIKNQPLESDKEKYYRVRDIYLKINPTFNKIQDSLFYSINEIVKDSIKTVKYDPVKVFLTSNYNVDDEHWRLAIKNPFNGKNFSVIMLQSKADARLNLSNNFSDILLQVKYYFNLISLTYEPIMVSATNKQSKKSFKTIVTYKDQSLLKNLYLTDNSFISIYGYDLSCRLDRGDIYYDENILRYFVNNGKPKYYINYGVGIRNLDDSNVNFAFQNFLRSDCSGCSYHTKLDYVPYFVNVKENNEYYWDETSIFELNKTAPIEINDGAQIKRSKSLHKKYLKKVVQKYTPEQMANLVSSISPNGKYFAVKVNTKTYLFETSAWTNLMNFDNTTGKLYWDCNSYYLGIGNDLIPVPLLDSLGTK